MTEKEWQERYMIMSVKGNIWTRSELRNRAVVKAAGYLHPSDPRKDRSVVRTAVQLVLDDPGFMRGRKGEVPARVIEDAAFEAFLNVADPKRHTATGAFLASVGWKGTAS